MTDLTTLLTRRKTLTAALSVLALPALGSSATTARTTPPEPGTALPHASVPGGIARLALGPDATRPVVTLRDGEQDVPVLVLGDARGWTALVGIALATVPGPAQVTVRRAAGSQSLPFTVRPKQ